MCWRRGAWSWLTIRRACTTTPRSRRRTWAHDRLRSEKMSGAIGAKALYFLFIWLISAAGASWLSERKGYGERVGLTFGLILSALGLLIVLVLPGRPGSKWRVDGWLPRWRRAAGDTRPPRRGPPV